MTSDRHPLHSRFDLASSASAVRWGRKHASEVLAEWGVEESVTHDALLIVSELLSNAVQHAVKPMESVGGQRVAVACGLRLWLTDRGLTVSVYDADRRPPVLRSPSIEAERGRGLHLVDALSEAWGYTHPSPTSGKLVWARLPLPAHVAGDVQQSVDAAGQPTDARGAVVMSA
ncbi:ATP-binding protein [Streptomyces sp. NPDC020917]|uniref:ATP-binding protein n=1 Tax=Streptomyces sp. NPDC020917 TaxID=3365102 RepID=UPI0037B030BB